MLHGRLGGGSIVVGESRPLQLLLVVGRHVRRHPHHLASLLGPVDRVSVSGSGRRSAALRGPLEGWRVASKGLGPLPRRRGSAPACGCDRSGRVVLRLARAAAVSTGLRVRGARGVTSHLQRGRERVPRQRDATRDARRKRLAGRVGRQDPGRRIIAFGCSRRHHSRRRRSELIVDHGTVFLEEPGNRWSAARSPHRLSRWPEAREGKSEQDDHRHQGVERGDRTSSKLLTLR